MVEVRQAMKPLTLPVVRRSTDPYPEPEKEQEQVVTPVERKFTQDYEYFYKAKQKIHYGSREPWKCFCGANIKITKHRISKRIISVCSLSNNPIKYCPRVRYCTILRKRIQPALV